MDIPNNIYIYIHKIEFLITYIFNIFYGIFLQVSRLKTSL